MKGKRYMYDNGDQVWTFEGKDWFVTTLEGDTKPVKRPNYKRIVVDMTNI